MKRPVCYWSYAIWIIMVLIIPSVLAVEPGTAEPFAAWADRIRLLI